MYISGIILVSKYA